MLTGAVGILVGPDVAFHWSNYLLLSLWPLSVYRAARLLDLPPLTAVVAAALAPFLSSHPGVGYELRAYMWAGYGLWAQLWASWTLPLAWAFTWRAFARRGPWLPAVTFIALTAALHYETGYLAVLGIVVMLLFVRGRLRSRIGCALGIGSGFVLVTAPVVLPLLIDQRWAAVNEVFKGTPYENGYGAGTILHWLFTGQVFDSGRLPVITALVGVGSCAVLSSWRA